MPFWLSIIVKLTPAFFSLIVGILGVYIAFNQYRTNRDKLRLDLFEKRIDAFENLQGYFNYLIREGTVEKEAIAILAAARYESFFLFGSEITEHINEVWDKAQKMYRLHFKLYGHSKLPIGEERNQVCEEENELLLWNLNQQESSPEKFSKYLKFM